MRVSGPIMETMNRLQQNGYAVTARVMAIHERYSLAGIHLRYEQQRAEKGFGRATAIETHDESYKGMPATIEQIERYKLAGRIEVMTAKIGSSTKMNGAEANGCESPRSGRPSKPNVNGRRRPKNAGSMKPTGGRSSPRWPPAARANVKSNRRGNSPGAAMTGSVRNAMAPITNADQIGRARRANRAG